MNLGDMLTNLQNQGPVFWAAAFSIAAGVTLLVVSVVTQIRSMSFSMGRNRVTLNPFSGNVLSNPFSRPKRTKTHNDIKITEDGYQPASISPLNPGPGSQKVASPDFSELTNRLHIAANALEEIRQGLRQDNFTPGFSVLKHEPEAVDYLFKTTAV